MVILNDIQTVVDLFEKRGTLYSGRPYFPMIGELQVLLAHIFGCPTHFLLSHQVWIRQACGRRTGWHHHASSRVAQGFELGNWRQELRPVSHYYGGRGCRLPQQASRRAREFSTSRPLVRISLPFLGHVTDELSFLRFVVGTTMLVACKSHAGFPRRRAQVFDVDGYKISLKDDAHMVKADRIMRRLSRDSKPGAWLVDLFPISECHAVVSHLLIDSTCRFD